MRSVRKTWENPNRYNDEARACLLSWCVYFRSRPSPGPSDHSALVRASTQHGSDEVLDFIFATCIRISADGWQGKISTFLFKILSKSLLVELFCVFFPNETLQNVWVLTSFSFDSRYERIMSRKLCILVNEQVKGETPFLVDKHGCAREMSDENWVGKGVCLL